MGQSGGTCDAVPRRRCALGHQTLRTGWPPLTVARAEGLEPPTVKPGFGDWRSATELRACGRRDRGRTDGLFVFRQAFYQNLSYSPIVIKVDPVGLAPTTSALQ